MHKKFHDGGKRAAEFLKELLVRCPRCEQQALVRSNGVPWRVTRATLTCSSCGHSDAWPGRAVQPGRSPTCDPYFGCALWFIGDIKGDVFWAYNREHLAFIRSYVAATLRIREPNQNRSLASRLPAFLLAKKNRTAVLKEIDRIAKL